MIQKIPIIAPPYANTNKDGIENELKSLNINNGFIDSDGFFVRRPGTSLLGTISGGNDVSSMYYWEAQDTLWIISSGNVYSIDINGNFTLKGTGLDIHNRAVWSATKIAGVDFLAFANGGRIYYSENSGSISPIADANAPTNVTSLAFVNNRLVVNDINSDIFYWSNLNDPKTWDALSYASAEGSPDVLNYLYNYQGDILLWGTKSMEKWYVTGNADAPFARRQGGTQNIGTLSPNSIIYDEETNLFIFLNHIRSVVLYDGTNIKKISEPIDRLLYDITNIEDATGDLIRVYDKKFYILSFPTDNKCYVLDLITGSWYTWGTYNGISGEMELLPFMTSLYIPEWGRNVGGSSSSRTLYLISPQVYTDYGTNIYSSITTGFIHCDTNISKSWKKLLVRVKQHPTSNVQYLVEYRKDSEGIFDPTRVRNINLGTGSLTPFHHTIYSFGSSRALQFRFSCSDNCPFCFGNAEIEYELNRG